jgi:glycosyltransferase involved in cell wall biosynthesis
MPAFDQADTLNEAVASVLGQTLDDLELVAVDDASRDGSGELLADWTRRDPRVRLLSRPCNSRDPRCPAEPRNDALDVAAGRYIAYIDADNRWRPTYLRRQVDALRRRPGARLTVAWSCNHHPTGRLAAHVAGDRRQPTAVGDTWVVYGVDEVRLADLGATQYVDTNEMVHPADVFLDLPERWRLRHPRAAWVNRNLGGRTPWRRHNDLDLVERIVARYGADAVVVVPEVLVDYYYPQAPRSAEVLLAGRGSPVGT